MSFNSQNAASCAAGSLVDSMVLSRDLGLQGGMRVPSDPSSLQIAFDRLQSEQMRLAHLTRELTEKLSPLLRPATPEKTAQGGAIGPAGSNLAVHVNGSANELAVIGNMLGDLLNRIDL